MSESKALRALEIANDKLNKRIAELEVELEKHRWIPVGERLPEEGKTLLLLNFNNPPFKVIYTGQWMDKKQEFWYANTETGIVKKEAITHWKPIVLP